MAVFMTLRQYLTVMALATLLCWVALALVVMNVDPFVANWLSLSFFYLSIFFAFFGTFSLLFFLLFHLFSQGITPMFRQVVKSFQIGFLVTAALTTLIYLWGRGWLEVWNTIIFFAAFVSFIVFLWFQRRARTINNPLV